MNIANIIALLDVNTPDTLITISMLFNLFIQLCGVRSILKSQYITSAVGNFSWSIQHL